MLIEFRVKNYGSFRDKTVLSAETGSRLRKFKATNTFDNKPVSTLKSLLIFGPNGAGKTQLLRALSQMERLVAIGGTQTVTQNLPYYPFLFDSSSKTKDTLFGIKILLGNKVYDYSFSYNRERIKSEVLTITSNQNTEIYFKRTENKLVTSSSELQSMVPKLRKNALFLFLAQQANDPEATNVFKWFDKDLLFVGNTGIPDEMLDLMKNENLKKEMLLFMNLADLNISDIVVRDVGITLLDENLEKIYDNMHLSAPPTIRQIFTKHKVYDENNNVISTEEINFNAESEGTRQLFYIVFAMIFSQINGDHKTIIIDEFDKSLHQELASSLIRVFNSVGNKNQFIVTTHDIQLLDDQVRTDQIYLVDKDYHGVSELKSIFDFRDARNKGRRDVSFAKRYISGQFGSVPVIDVDGLVNLIANTSKRFGKKDDKKK